MVARTQNTKYLVCPCNYRNSSCIYIYSESPNAWNRTKEIAYAIEREQNDRLQNTHIIVAFIGLGGVKNKRRTIIQVHGHTGALFPSGFSNDRANDDNNGSLVTKVCKALLN